MYARFILAAVAAIFVIAAAIRGFAGPQARIWLVVAAILTLVSIWLFTRA